MERNNLNIHNENKIEEIQYIKNTINEIFMLLDESLEKFINIVSKQGKEAFEKGDFDLANKLSQTGNFLKNYKININKYFSEFQQYVENNFPKKLINENKIYQDLNDFDSYNNYQFDKDITYEKRSKKENEITKIDEYKIPILESLIELGGRAEVYKVLDKVYEKVKNILTPRDKELLRSVQELRWRNKAKWCRKNMIFEGLLRNDSPHGIWEITKKGIDYYNNYKNKKIKK
ncbi:MAG: winged helix-turn-helix domain-containing protein [Candidatus Ratteibacteria bacterium]